MTYEQLIETVSEILENEKINKKGLILVYELEPKLHKAFNEILFYKSNPPTINPVLTDEFEVEIDGILIKFIKKIQE